MAGPRVFDAFTFYNEFDILELRLRELWGVVDRFVLVEATHTFTGQPKPLYFAENKARFAPFLDKIVHVVVDDLQHAGDAWSREARQRNAVARGLDGLQADDIVMISDVDEIPRPAAVLEAKRSPFILFGFRMLVSYFKINNINVTGEAGQVLTIGLRGLYFRVATANRLRNALRGTLSGGPSVLPGLSVRVFAHGGWHLSYMGDEEHIRNKIRNFSHQEFNTPEVLESVRLDALLSSGRDLFGRPGYTWQVIRLTPYFPETVCRERTRWLPFLAEGGRQGIVWDGTV